MVADCQPRDEPRRWLGETAYQSKGPDSFWRMRPVLPRQRGTLVWDELGDHAMKLIVFQAVGDFEFLH